MGPRLAGVAASTLTRAVLFSAFATLAFSAHPGTPGLGILLTMNLLGAFAALLLVLPPLLHAFARDAGTVPLAVPSPVV